VEPMQSFGIADFLAQTDTVGKAAIVILLVMSVTTWYLVLTKAMHIAAAQTKAKRFLDMFWNAPSLQAVAEHLRRGPAEDAYAQLTAQALAARHHHAQHGQRLAEAGSAQEFLTRAMRQSLDIERANMESGLTLLASIGSTAPFVGLFGTVWGVYRALINIGMQGQGTLDKVAGPVGEALIMTALGLAVAVPAVLAYNAITRRNRLALTRLDAFAHDLYAFCTTGVRVDDPGRSSDRTGETAEQNPRARSRPVPAESTEAR